MKNCVERFSRQACHSEMLTIISYAPSTARGRALTRANPVRDNPSPNRPYMFYARIPIAGKYCKLRRWQRFQLMNLNHTIWNHLLHVHFYSQQMNRIGLHEQREESRTIVKKSVDIQL